MAGAGEVLKRTVRSFLEHEVGLRAGALAYYTLLSLFPLLLFLIFIGSQFLTSVDARAGVDAYLQGALPAAADSLQQVIDQTLRARGPIGLVGAAGLVWTSSGVFSVLSSSFSLIWGAQPRVFWRRRMLAVLAVLAIGALYVISLSLGAVLTLDSSAILGFRQPAISVGASFIVTWVFLSLVYFLFPNRSVDLRAALGGGALGALLWEAAKWGFSLYITSGFTRFGLVYGSLASIIVIMLWVYLSAMILFLGAEFGASIQHVLNGESRP